MAQARLPVIQVAPERKEDLDEKLREIYQNLEDKFKVFGTFQDVLAKSKDYHSIDLKDEQTPEEFAKRAVIEPLIEFLGYELVPETVLPSPGGRKKPDYTIRPKNKDKPIFYVEAEPINVDLDSKDHGVSQVKDWLISRASRTDYGIATDGLQWILLKFDTASAQSKEFFSVDLRPVFIKLLNPAAFVSQEEVEKIEEDFLAYHREYISLFLEGYLERIERTKEEISKKFYNDYVRYVFGYDEKGDTIKGTCLLRRVVTPSGVGHVDANAFSVVFMNRMIFVKFLEEKGIVPKNLLKKMLEDYKHSRTPASFYETYLKPLFYEVFNKSKEGRAAAVRKNALYSQIPYLNGGLFREVVESERSFNIENEGVELVIENLLDRYEFGLESDINPDILGYIFEKTINFISGTGTNQQRMKGAYYTPDDTVGFIIEETLTPIVFRKMIDGLKEAGWSDADLKGYNSIEDILDPENMPKNPMHIKKMIESLGTLRILDPACGSGHFLTAVLSLILRVQESLLRTNSEDVERYKLKREIISQNLFGVDIDENAVEIARLRLWLSIIEEVEDPEHIETLPNIDFNIIAGNSLVGWLDENLLTHPLIDLSKDSYVQEALDGLSSFYGNRVDDVRKLLGRMKLADTIKAYEMLLEMYSLESGDRAVKIRDVLEGIRNKLYIVINNSYLDFLHEYGNLDKDEFDEVGRKLSSRTPFHWRIDFGYVFAEGGFDVVVGNPPYIENRNYNETDLKIVNCHRVTKKGRRKVREPLFYHSNNCGNTHAYFIERSIKLLAQNGRFGFIVPISLVSTDRMDDIREFIHNNSFNVKYYNFDDRPGKIFSGLEHCRSTILVTERGSGVRGVTTSRYHRWYSEDRSKLFENLKTSDWRIVAPGDIVPKIGTEIEKRILAKLSRKAKGKTIRDFVKDDGVRIWYHNSPQYWIHVHTEDHVPKVEYYEGYREDADIANRKIPYNLKETKISAQYKSLAFDLESSAIINGLLNSSLFYWWFVIWSDGRHLLDQHIRDFPIDIKSFPEDLKKKTKPLVDKLMKSYDDNSNTKVNLRTGGYVIKIREIIPSKSKNIIDQIDDVFANHFAFSDEEREFIKEFDIEFRT